MLHTDGVAAGPNSSATTASPMCSSRARASTPTRRSRASALRCSPTRRGGRWTTPHPGRQGRQRAVGGGRSMEGVHGPATRPAVYPGRLLSTHKLLSALNRFPSGRRRALRLPVGRRQPEHLQQGLAVLGVNCAPGDCPCRPPVLHRVPACRLLGLWAEPAVRGPSRGVPVQCHVGTSVPGRRSTGVGDRERRPLECGSRGALDAADATPRHDPRRRGRRPISVRARRRSRPRRRP